MRTLGLLACGFSAFALASMASASPLTDAVSKSLAAADIELIEPVHGCHREVLPDRWGWHYHRRNCRRASVTQSDYGPFGPYDPYRCYGVGLTRICP